MPGKPYHELTDKEFKALIDEKITYGELGKRHPQPEWCHYHDAIGVGSMGCWSLTMFRNKISRDYCKDCDCFEKSC